MSVILLTFVLSLRTGYVTIQLGHTSVIVRMVIKRTKQATVVKVGSVHVCDTVWWVIFRRTNFRGKSGKTLRINSRGLNFVTATQSRGAAWHCTNDDV